MINAFEAKIKTYKYLEEGRSNGKSKYSRPRERRMLTLNSLFTNHIGQEICIRFTSDSLIITPSTLMSEKPLKLNRGFIHLPDNLSLDVLPDGLYDVDQEDEETFFLTPR